MRHRRRSLLSASGSLPIAVMTVVFGCERDGRIVVLLDSTRLAGGVEVVAVQAEAAAAAAASGTTSDSIARLRAIDDSVETLDARFRAGRDSINRDVAALDSVDRRTRGYALRYADIRRRTAVAEHTRAARDAARSRADTLRGRLAPSLIAASRADGENGQGVVRRARATTSPFALHLPPGEWLIGAAPAGAHPRRFERVQVGAGGQDTLRLALPPH
jgi:hypothetical protein